MGGIKVTAADSWFSKCVRERTDYHCERCGASHHRSSQGLHASHFHSRGNWSTRFDPDNTFAHCYGCHAYLGGRPSEFEAWVKSKLGEGRFEILQEKAHTTKIGREVRRMNKRKEISKHYREQHKSLCSMRDCGRSGRIEFIGL